jgi:hypothetical protein
MPGGVGPESSFAQIRRDLGSKVVYPATHGLIRYRDPALSQQIFDVPEAQGEPEIEPDCLLDDLQRKPVTALANLSHDQSLPAAGSGDRTQTT